jgi:hypothetical protein
MRRAVVVVLLFMSAAVYADDTARAQLAENRAKWQALHIADYSFTLWMNGAWTRATAIQIVVRKGEVKSAHYMLVSAPFDRTSSWESRESWELREGPVAEPAWWLTIPALFKRAEENLNRPGAETLLRFDPKFGFPTEIASHQPQLSDSQFALWVNSFTVLK